MACGRRIIALGSLATAVFAFLVLLFVTALRPSDGLVSSGTASGSAFSSTSAGPASSKGTHRAPPARVSSKGGLPTGSFANRIKHFYRQRRVQIIVTGIVAAVLVVTGAVVAVVALTGTASANKDLVPAQQQTSPQAPGVVTWPYIVIPATIALLILLGGPLVVWHKRNTKIAGTRPRGPLDRNTWDTFFDEQGALKDRCTVHDVMLHMRYSGTGDARIHHEFWVRVLGIRGWKENNADYRNKLAGLEGEYGTCLATSSTVDAARLDSLTTDFERASQAGGARAESVSHILTAFACKYPRWVYRQEFFQIVEVIVDSVSHIEPVPEFLAFDIFLRLSKRYFYRYLFIAPDRDTFVSQGPEENFLQITDTCNLVLQGEDRGLFDHIEQVRLDGFTLGIMAQSFLSVWMKYASGQDLPELLTTWSFFLSFPSQIDAAIYMIAALILNKHDAIMSINVPLALFPFIKNDMTEGVDWTAMRRRCAELVDKYRSDGSPFALCR